MLSVGILIFGFFAGFMSCAWMMGQKKILEQRNNNIIDAEYTEYKRPDKIDTWA